MRQQRQHRDLSPEARLKNAEKHATALINEMKIMSKSG